MPNSMPASPRDAQSNATRGIMQPAPSSTVWSSVTRSLRSLWRTTSPSMPSSLMSVLLPAPITVTAIPDSVQRRSSSASTTTSRVVVNHRAGPPTPNWLWRASGSSHTTPGNMSSQSAADTLHLQSIAESRRQPVEPPQGEHQAHLPGSSHAHDQVDRRITRLDQMHRLGGTGTIGDVPAGDRLRHAALPSLLDRTDDHDVGAREARPVVLEQPAHPRVGVGSVYGDEPAARIALAGAGGGGGGPRGGGGVGVGG